MADAGRPRGAARIPHSWQIHLRRGVRARVLASIELEHTQIPLDVDAWIQIQDPGRLTIRLELPDRPAIANGTDDGVATLTQRERAVIDLVATGKASQEIGKALHISPATVRTHVRNAMAKVGAHTRAQLIAIVLGTHDAASPLRERADDAAGSGIP